MIEPLRTVPMAQESRPIDPPPGTPYEEGFLDMPAPRRKQVLLVKRRRLIKAADANPPALRQESSAIVLPTQEPCSVPDPTPRAESPQNLREVSGGSSTEPPAKRPHIEVSVEGEPLQVSSGPSSRASPKRVPPATLWPEDYDNFPYDLISHLILPEDDHRYEGVGLYSLLNAAAIHQSRATALVGRIIHEGRRNASREQGLIAEAQRLSKLNEEADLRANKLQADLDAAIQKASEAEKIIESLNNDRAEKSDLIGSLERKLESTEYKVVLAEEARASAENTLAGYQALGPPFTEEVRRQVQLEYRKSAELNNEILEQFVVGYQEARDKDKQRMLTAKLDPSILDSSDDEAGP